MLTTLRPPFLPNSTEPACSANSVSSPPRPTPAPGWKWVPRWRTMISPALTTWPPKRLTPNRWELESRPLRVELAPFLCAISNLPRLLDAGYLDAREVLTVPLALLVTGLVLELLDDDLGAAQLAENLGGDGHLSQLVGVGGDVVSVDQEHRGQLDLVAELGLLTIEDDDRADLDLLLAATGAHYCVNHFTPVSLGNLVVPNLTEDSAPRGAASREIPNYPWCGAEASLSSRRTQSGST
ncbi:hypothetical protein MIC448_190004 [Microbacterium sp. C448]|nr:hypothetical protein MIC448_190004 [Microbacterium sp. C448]